LQRSQREAGFNRRERREEQKNKHNGHERKKASLPAMPHAVSATACLFAEADGFNYLDYNDASEQMARYFEEGFLAWIRLFCR
jgi:hypothetical protein